MNDKPVIMIVDDDPNIVQLIRLYLTRDGYDAVSYGRGDEALAAFKQDPPSLLILDIMLPGMDGWSVCREVRKISQIPIIMLTAEDDTFDKVLGLELGADDYMTKPFDGKELLARVKAVLRRSAPSDGGQDTLSFPGLTISLEKYEVYYQGKPMEMPPKELELLYFLAAHKNRVFTREQLLEQVWGFDFFGDSRTVDVHVKRLREKLVDCEKLGWQIRTVWSVGYKFEVK
ncbi:MAG: response regulator transcription factor [Clostridia bacterium]|nr:response regulator transcription factor [Clostridia bacterium]